MLSRLLGVAKSTKPTEIDKRAHAATEAFLRSYVNPTNMAGDSAALANNAKPVRYMQFAAIPETLVYACRPFL